MTPEDQAKRLEVMEQKIDAIFASVEKARQYALITTVITIAVIVLPLIGLFIAIPQFLNTYSNLDSYSTLDAQMELLKDL